MSMLLCSGAADTNISDTNIESTGITSGITTGEVIAATVTPVVFVTLIAGIIVLMVVIYLKRARSVHCSVDSYKVLDIYSHRSLKVPTLNVERTYIGLYHFCMLQGSVFKYCIHTCTDAPQQSLVQQRLQQLPQRLLFSKDQIHLSSTVGQGLYSNRLLSHCSTGYKQLRSPQYSDHFLINARSYHLHTLGGFAHILCI